VANPSSTSRRQVLQLTAGVAAGLVSVSAASAVDAPPTSPAGPPDYPKPPFPHQQQPWPGLTSKMTPRPDHGESSYRGSGRLAGRKALITGGDSGMGRAAARQSPCRGTSARRHFAESLWKTRSASSAVSTSWSIMRAGRSPATRFSRSKAKSSMKLSRPTSMRTFRFRRPRYRT